MRGIGCTARELDIRPAAQQMLKDIGHPHRDDAAVYDIAFENVQAGERTSHLFRLANQHGGIVVGTVLTLLFLPALYVTWFRVKEPKPEAIAPTPARVREVAIAGNS